MVSNDTYDSVMLSSNRIDCVYYHCSSKFEEWFAREMAKHEHRGVDV